MLVEAFMLGLATGTYCVTACAPVALPIVFAEESKPSRPALLALGDGAARTGIFLLGRLVAYVAVGFVLGATGAYAAGFVDPKIAHAGIRIAALVSGAVLIVGGAARNFSKGKLCELARRAYKPGSGLFVAGLATGLSLCPPFFAAAARVFGGAASGPLEGAAFFALFFLGTSVWFLPLLGVPFAVRKAPMLTLVARSAMPLLGLYYIAVVGLLGTV